MISPELWGDNERQICEKNFPFDTNNHIRIRTVFVLFQICPLHSTIPDNYFTCPFLCFGHNLIES